ncbi:MAG: Ig-like domain repeat protein, partial [Lachnospiraceae bacterium]|nr:Ig-like domain repeat protein [Lachnospiraceae bacterium]
KKVGEVTITAEKQGDDYYEKQEKSYQLKINKANRTIAFDEKNPFDITYGTSYVNIARPSASAQEQYTITYSVNDESVASVNGQGEVIPKKAGNIIVTARVEEDEYYKTAECTYSLTIKRADQNLAFEHVNEEIVYNPVNPIYGNTLVNNKSKGKILYSVVSTEDGAEYADFNEETGTFMIKGAGKFTIKAVVEEDDCYNASEEQYELTVKKAVQEIKFSKEEYSLVYGTNFEITPTAEKKYSSDNSKIQYSILSGNEIASINTETGVLTFKSAVGTVVVKATKPEDKLFTEASTTYKLTVSKLPVSDYRVVCYTDGLKNSDENEWFTGEVSIVGREGYQLSLSDDLYDNEWKDVLEDIVTEDTKEDIIYVYAKSKQGITDKIPVKIKKDREAPEGKISVENISTWEKFLTIIQTGSVSEKVNVRVSDIYDKISDIGKVEYYLNRDVDQAILTREELNRIPSGEWHNTPYKKEKNTEKYYAEFQLEKNTKYVIYVRITDNAGNDTYITTNGIIIDEEGSKITLTPEAPNENGFYNRDVNVRVTVDELSDESYSGIKRIDYRILCPGQAEPTQSGNLYTYENENPEYRELKKHFGDEDNNVITIQAEKNNSDNIEVHIEVTDNAGNVTSNKDNPLKLNIDVTKPKIKIDFNNNNTKKTVGDRGYYSETRTAVVTITERTSGFNKTRAKEEGIKIIATDAKGNRISLPNFTWVTREAVTGTPDETIHQAVITFSNDANYNFDVSYTDNAGNKNEDVDYGNSATPNQFTVDKTAPTGAVNVSSFNKTWERLLHTLTFGLWSKDKTEITAAAQDTTSPLEKIYYYKTSDTTAKTREELERITDWLEFQTLEVRPDDRFAIYLKIQDYAGNITYIGSDGIILDNTPTAISITPEPSVSGVYGSDVNIAVTVEEPEINGAFSGLRQITYKVLNMGQETQAGTLYIFQKENPEYSDLLKKWSGTLTVKKEMNNSNDVTVIVWAEDNAGNTYTQSTNIRIDITAPDIRIRYDNNEGDTSFAGETLFKENRRAEITITERNFRAEDVKINIANTDGTLPVVSEWTVSGAGGNGDGTTHTATILYSADGDYSFSISYADMAGNPAAAPDYGNSLAPESFTIDKTMPAIVIDYDNNNSVNGNFFRADRTAAITITEHNFEPSRVNVTIRATDDGNEITPPSIDSWRSDGDTHRASVHFINDGLYTFDISYTDKAGNPANVISTQTFYVDKTLPSVTIRGIENHSANSGRENIGFILECTDTNMDIFEPVLTTVVKEGGRFVTKTIEGNFEATKNGRIYTVTNLLDDGIYRLTCKAADKAGNTYNAITMIDSAGNARLEDRTQEEEVVTFSVNREGSVFEPGEATMQLVEHYYVQKVYNDIVITEINVDPLKQYHVKLNGTELKEGRDYTLETVSGADSWCQYVYTLNRDLFEEEGEYTVIVESVDKAETTAYSDVKNLNVSFVVDKTAPNVTVSGVRNSGRYQVKEQSVTAIPTDNGGRLYSFKAVVLDVYGNPLKDSSGSDISVRFDMSGEELLEYLKQNGGKISFTIPEGLENQVIVTCRDCAVDENGNTNEYSVTFKRVTVSPSGLIIFYANKPLFYGIIGGAAFVLIGIVGLILWKRRKNR